MEIDRKLLALDRIYSVYDEFLRGRDAACQMRCHVCCTTRVALTTLEAYRICDGLTPGEREKLFRRVGEASGIERLRPALTINALAELCAEDGELPAENEAPAMEKCPLLAEELCSIYGLRPFNCRCFTSRRPCGERGYADVDETTLAVNTLFLQTLEHLDADGCSGNLLDVLGVLASEKKRSAYAAGRRLGAGDGLIANRPMRVLMLPPERREEIAPVLRKLRAVRV
jgi:hypothetical protein